jgi:Rad3-related DNA helicase
MLQAPTGSGKTPLSVGLRHVLNEKVMVLVKTKALQEANYEDGYGFKILKGKDNYPCNWDKKSTVGGCYFQEHSGGSENCPLYDSCVYFKLREQAKKAPLVCLNYALYLSSGWAKESHSILVCDEADDLPRLITDWAGLTIKQSQADRFGLEDLPLIGEEGDRNKLVAWLETAKRTLKGIETSSDHNFNQQREMLGRKIGAAIPALANRELGNWHIRSGPNQLVAKPLTAKHIFREQFLGGHYLTLLMSATIGDNGTLMANILGLPEDYKFLDVPNRWSPEERPIYIPEDAPRMGRKATEADHNYQADIVAKAILDRPLDWPGLILVNSKAQALSVLERLAKRGLDERLWITPDGEPTQEHYRQWGEQKRIRPGALCVTWNFHRGFDGLDEKIVVSMKVPFAPRGEPGTYENDRLRATPGMYQWETASKLEQSMGRTRRGRASDYGADNGLVMVADSNWRMVKKYLSQDFKDAIVQ